MNTYEQSGHEPIGRRQTRDAALFGQGEHDVQEGDKAGHLHGGPTYFARDVEPRIDRGLTLRIPVRGPFHERELRPRNGLVLVLLVVVVVVGQLTMGKSFHSQTRSSQCSRDGGNQPSTMAMGSEISRAGLAGGLIPLFDHAPANMRYNTTISVCRLLYDVVMYFR